MRDPYLYDGTNVLINNAGIRDADLLKKAEADITNLAMTALYEKSYDIFNSDTLCDIHRSIFGQIYDWAGEFRNIPVVKYEEVLGGDTVRYAHPDDIKKLLAASMKEIAKLKRSEKNDRDIVFRMVRIISAVWQIHPFREGNTRSIIVFAVLLAKHLGFDVDPEVFSKNASYVRNSLVWGSQGIYSKYEYLERIFYDAILHTVPNDTMNEYFQTGQYEKIGDYNVKEYVEQPHIYSK